MSSADAYRGSEVNGYGSYESSNDSFTYVSACSVCTQMYPDNSYHICYICGTVVCSFCVDTRETSCGIHMRMEKVNQDDVFLCSQFCIAKYDKR